MGCLDDIVRVVNESASPNVAQLVGSQCGDVIVPMYDWSSYFEDKTLKTSLKGITQMHHFHFSRCHLKDPSWRPTDFPQQLIPPGLSFERQQYLCYCIPNNW